MSPQTSPTPLADTPLATIAQLALFLDVDPQGWTGELLSLIDTATNLERQRINIGFPFLVSVWEIWQAADIADSRRGCTGDAHRPPTGTELDALVSRCFGEGWRERYPRGMKR